MELKSVDGTILFALETAKTTAELVVAAVQAKANLGWANLRGADLHGADLHGADLGWADLRWADLHGADLRGADLHGADLGWANLRGADLGGANLRGADLREAHLHGAKNIPIQTYLQTTIVPEKGKFTGFKKCQNGILVELEATESSKRSNSTGRKCRVSEALVVKIYGASEARSIYDPSFVYREGEIVRPVFPFDEDRWNECGSGIHLFITRQEAEEYE